MRVKVKKKMWLPLIAILFFSSFAAIMLVSAQVANVALEPAVCACDPYDPVPPTDRGYFIVNLTITDVVDLAAWEAVVRWDPAVLACVGVTFGPFMDPLTHNNVYLIELGKVTLGQYATQAGNVDGSGDLAYINMTCLYPGETPIFFERVSLYNDGNPPGIIDTTTTASEYHSHNPVPVWYHNATAHTLPNVTCKVDCHEIQFGDVVMFNGTDSWDPDGDGIAEYWFDFGDGTNSTSTGQSGPIQYHIYQDYQNEAYHPFLKVTDDSIAAKFWQSNWYEQKPFHDVRIYRDVGIVNIWPSIDYLDSVDYFWPFNGTHVQHRYGDPGGGDILVSAVNYGSVDEVMHVELFAVFLEYRTHLTPDGWQVDTTNEIYLVDEWTFTLGAMGGTGFSLWAMFQPPHKGNYALFAKVDVTICSDEPTENQYMICPRPISVFTDKTDYAIDCADVDGSGKVDTGELFILGKHWFKSVGC